MKATIKPYTVDYFVWDDNFDKFQEWFISLELKYSLEDYFQIYSNNRLCIFDETGQYTKRVTPKYIIIFNRHEHGGPFTGFRILDEYDFSKNYDR